MKPTPKQRLALQGLHDGQAAGGQAVNAFSTFWKAFRLRGWISDEGWVTAEGTAVLNRYKTIILTCNYCDRRVGDYVARVGVEKTLERTCPCCGIKRFYTIPQNLQSVYGVSGHG